MPEITEVDAYLAEGAHLIRQAEECAGRLHQNGACEGHRRMAAATQVAMHRIYLLIQAHRDRSAQQTPSLPVARSLREKRRWWSGVSRRAYRPIDL